MAEYGLYPVLLLAGFLGSLVYLAAQDGPPTSVWLAVSPIFAGTLTANYLPHLVLSYFFNEVVATGGGSAAGAFATGVCGPLCAKWIIKKAKTLNLNNGKVP